MAIVPHAGGGVSIHARHCWRANPTCVACRHWSLRVSIHARHCWRANPSGWRAKWVMRNQFQSTPAIAGGRIRQHRLTDGAWLWFQSTPAIAGGRIQQSPPLHAVTAWFQSTPAIAGGRIRHVVALAGPVPVFQSTPAIAGGRIHAEFGSKASVRNVSIHARHCWRANPPWVKN